MTTRQAIWEGGRGGLLKIFPGFGKSSDSFRRGQLFHRHLYGVHTRHWQPFRQGIYIYIYICVKCSTIADGFEGSIIQPEDVFTSYESDVVT